MRDRLLCCGTAGQRSVLLDSPAECGTVGKYAVFEKTVDKSGWTDGQTDRRTDGQRDRRTHKLTTITLTAHAQARVNKGVETRFYAK